MKTSDYKRIWIELVTEKLEHDFSYTQIVVKLKRVQFDRRGEIKSTRAGLYAKQHFPSLLRLFRERCQGSGSSRVQLSLF